MAGSHGRGESQEVADYSKVQKWGLSVLQELSFQLSEVGMQ